MPGPTNGDWQHTYAWLQARVRDIFAAALKTPYADPDLATVLSAVDAWGQDVKTPFSGYFNGLAGWAQTQGPPVPSFYINPLAPASRTDYPVKPVCVQPPTASWLTYVVYHEARHAYQRSLTSLSNDEDKDYLVDFVPIPVPNTMPDPATGVIAPIPMQVFKDSGDVRQVCDELNPNTVYDNANPGRYPIQDKAFLGPTNQDGWGSNWTGGISGVPGAGWALEMDAYLFASQKVKQCTLASLLILGSC